MFDCVVTFNHFENLTPNYDGLYNQTGMITNTQQTRYQICTSTTIFSKILGLIVEALFPVPAKNNGQSILLGELHVRQAMTNGIARSEAH